MYILKLSKNTKVFQAFGLSGLNFLFSGVNYCTERLRGCFFVSPENMLLVDSNHLFLVLSIDLLKATAKILMNLLNPITFLGCMETMKYIIFNLLKKNCKKLIIK